MTEILKSIDRTGLRPIEISQLPEKQRTRILEAALQETLAIRESDYSKAVISGTNPDGRPMVGRGASAQRERASRQSAKV